MRKPGTFLIVNDDDNGEGWKMYLSIRNSSKSKDVG